MLHEREKNTQSQKVIAGAPSIHWCNEKEEEEEKTRTLTLTLC